MLWSYPSSLKIRVSLTTTKTSFALTTNWLTYRLKFTHVPPT